MRRRRIINVLLNLLVVVILIVTLFPFFIMLTTALKTDAASVEATTEPINIPSIQPMPNTRLQNTPTRPAVINVPTVDIKIDGAITGFAVFQLVPNPPKNIIKTSPTEQTFFAIS